MRTTATAAPDSSSTCRNIPASSSPPSQIGTNALALLGGVVGEAAFSPFFKWCLSFVFTPEQIHGVDFVISFVLATLLFVIFADLLPKRLAVAKPEETAMTVVRPTFV